MTNQNDVSLTEQIIDDYDASSIDILEGLEPVRKRPGMYIGAGDRVGLHHLIFEISDNAVDEAMAGFCDEIDITFYPEDNSVEIKDNGRGIPVDIHPKKGISAATIIFTVLHAGGKFGSKDSAYKVSGGLHGVGASVTNALSTYLEINVNKNGKVYYQRFEKGVPVDILKGIRDMRPDEKTGTTVRFSPDPEIFKAAMDEEDGIKLSADYIRDRIKRTAYLVKNLKFNLTDENGVKTVYYSENGIVDMVSEQTELLIKNEGIKLEDENGDELNPTLFEQNFYYTEKDTNSEVEVSFNYVNKYFKSNILSFANNIFTSLGGTHLKGFENAIKKSLTDYAAKHNDIKQVFSLEDILEGVNVVISYKTEEPEFTSQTKERLSTREATKLVFKATKDFIDSYLDENPATAQTWIKKIIDTQRMRENFEKMQLNARKNQSIQGLSGPTKLADCQSKKPEECELFLVEGDSAGGSAKQARDRRTQAILPLKGKILNISKISDQKTMLESVEIKSLISALKCGHGKEFNYDKLRYHKIIIMTDADVDGSHIATLFLNLFLREMPELVIRGHKYLAMPPLYVVKKKADYTYYADDKTLNDAFPNGLPNGYTKQRFKGLGEMNPKELGPTTMNPNSRNLMQVVLDPDNSDTANAVYDELMGEEVDKRKEFIMANAKKADLDI